MRMTLTPVIQEGGIGPWLQEDLMSDWQPDFDRFESDLNDRDAPTSPSTKIWIYVDNTRVLSTEDKSKLLSSLNLAQGWFTESNLAGVDFDYEVLKRLRCH
jgi:hypothetical protein